MQLLINNIFKNVNFRLLEKYLFISLIIIFLTPIWGNKYFLTQDGPSHLYNSKILLDFVTSNNLEFYKEYYIVNKQLFPNWFSHIILAFLPDQYLKGPDVVNVLDRLKHHKKEIPKRIQVDNGSEFISKILDCWAYENNVTLDYSRPGKPTDNPFIESFNRSFRDECLNVNWFLT